MLVYERTSNYVHFVASIKNLLLPRALRLQNIRARVLHENDKIFSDDGFPLHHREPHSVQPKIKQPQCCRGFPHVLRIATRRIVYDALRRTRFRRVSIPKSLGAKGVLTYATAFRHAHVDDPAFRLMWFWWCRRLPKHYADLAGEERIAQYEHKYVLSAILDAFIVMYYCILCVFCIWNWCKIKETQWKVIASTIQFFQTLLCLIFQGNLSAPE